MKTCEGIHVIWQRCNAGQSQRLDLTYGTAGTAQALIRDRLLFESRWIINSPYRSAYRIPFGKDYTLCFRCLAICLAFLSLRCVGDSEIVRAAGSLRVYGLGSCAMGQTDGRIVVLLDAPYRRAGAQSITHSCLLYTSPSPRD